MKRFLSYAIAICLPAIALASPESDAQFAKANQEYAANDFKGAIAEYENVVRSGEWSAPLFYDLGNAYFRTGDFGFAILNYERALALEPRHPEAQANLQIARDEARSLELQSTVFDRFLKNGNARSYTVAAAATFWLGLFGLAILVFARRRSPALVLLTLLSWIACAGLAASVWQIETGNGGRSLAIVTAKNVEARVATADNAGSVLALPAGSEIRVLQQRGDWTYAVLPNNLRGWIPAKAAELVRL